MCPGGSADGVRRDLSALRIWIDIDNPPQVQYLIPFRAAFADLGAEIVVTARDYGQTVEMLERAQVQAHVFGTRVGRGKLRKGAAALVRARDHGRWFARTGRPDLLLAASRSAAVAAWRMGIQGFVIADYEFAHVGLFRIAGSMILHPDVIDQSAFLRRGLRADRLIPFKGLKEDLTFAGIDVNAAEAYDLGQVPVEATRVLFRPPSETSHYYREQSSAMARASLERLALSDALVVFSPREREQVALLDGLAWRHPPVILDRSVPFISLLKSVDAVVTAGGTMLREAAYLGIPAYSVFRSEIGGVDRWLASIGRVRLLSGPEDLGSIELTRRGPLKRLDSNPHLLDEIVAIVAAHAGRPLGVPLAS